MSPTRRQCLAAAAAAAFAFASTARPADPQPTLRACIIGHTGKGDYGHGLDMVFARPGFQLLAVADPDPTGRANAARRTGAPRQYADYRQMLQTEKPQIVSIGPRQTPLRREMLLACLNAGAHVMCEKPFVRSPADGDQILALARQNNLRIAVAHQMRLAPPVVHLKKRMDNGLIGDLLHIHAFGKQDARAGGEDLLVLGVHLFDLMRLFAGDPLWCTARILHHGRDATRADAKYPTEDLGPVLGDQIDAQFGFANSVLATFTSRQPLRTQTAHWGIELIGSKASARILADIWPRVFVQSPSPWQDSGRTDAWKPLDDDPSIAAPAQQRSTALANARVLDDLLAAIRENREPACSGRNAAWAVEMALATFHAALSSARTPLPLPTRSHPLE